MNKPCPNCGHINPPENAFCGKCGKVIAEQPQPMPETKSTPEERAAQWGWNTKATSNRSTKGCLIALGIVAVFAVICYALGQREKSSSTTVGTYTPPSGTSSTPGGKATPKDISHQSDRERFMSTMRSIDTDGSLIISVNQGLTPDTLNVTVSNAWHYQPYQVRYQMAQNLWNLWARIHSPGEPDKARLSIRDLNGNEVGGSRVWAGSLIWVQDE